MNKFIITVIMVAAAAAGGIAGFLLVQNMCSVRRQ